MGAAAQYLQLGGAEEEAGRLGELLAAEARRFEEIARLLRLLAEDGRSAGPVELRELLGDVVALHRHHRDLRMLDCVVDGAGDVLPVWSPRSALVRAMLAVVAIVQRDAGVADGTIAVRCAGDDEEVSITVSARGAAGAGPSDRAARTPSALDAIDVAALREIARGAGGELAERPRDAAAGGDAAGYEIRLPTLPAVRRRERDARS